MIEGYPLMDSKGQRKIYNVVLFLKNTKVKKKKKSACVIYRVKQEEEEFILNRIRFSGMKIQNYLAQSSMYNHIFVIGNKTFDNFRNEMNVSDESLL